MTLSKLKDITALLSFLGVLALAIFTVGGAEEGDRASVGALERRIKELEEEAHAMGVSELTFALHKVECSVSKERLSTLEKKYEVDHDVLTELRGSVDGLERPLTKIIESLNKLSGG
tara:strand:- start:2434 stop:2784 length:351 start_codon:yes stop_codon:yes gene_type:complete